MKTILVPTDFSVTAYNAGRYALSLAKQLGTKKIILFNAYQAPVIGDSLFPSIAMIDMESIQKISDEGLRKQRESLQEINDAGIEINIVNVFNFFMDGVATFCESVPVDLIVIGITGETSGIEEALVGSNTVALAKETTIPLVIVPPNAVYKPIHQLLFACDFKKIIETTPIDTIRHILGSTKSKLHVLHVSHQGDRYSTETEHEIRMLDGMLKGLNPEYAFVENNDFTEAINKYVIDNSIDLIIAIPKKHGLFEGLFRKSHAKMLAFHSHVPLMSIHE